MHFCNGDRVAPSRFLRDCEDRWPSTLFQTMSDRSSPSDFSRLSFWPPAFSRHVGFLQEHKDFFRVGSIAVIGIRVSVDDRAISANDVSGGNGQRPFIGPVRRRNVSSEFLIGALQFVAESVHKAEGSADLLSDVAEHFKAQRVFLSSRKSIVRLFRTDSNKRRAGGRYVRKNLLKRLKLKIAIRTPAAAIECHDDSSASAAFRRQLFCP